jgi:ATP-dependent Clp protease protease subunit
LPVKYNVNTGTCILSGEIDETATAEFLSFLAEMSTLDPSPGITVYISSYGGLMDPTFAMIDMLRSYPAEVTTVALGYAASAGAWLLLAGDHRIASPHVKIMYHELSGGIPYVNYSQQKAYSSDVDATHRRMVDFLCSRSKLTRKQVEAAMKETVFYDAQEALELGIVHKIMPVRKVPKKV